MSNVVKITGSPATLVGAASVLSAKGEALEADLSGLLGDIQRQESDAVIGTDSFAHEFIKTYRKDTPTADGSAWATTATQQAARSLGTAATELGNAVGAAMQDYLVTDGEGAADISSLKA